MRRDHASSVFRRFNSRPRFAKTFKSCSSHCPQRVGYSQKICTLHSAFVGDIEPPTAHEFATNLAGITFDPFSVRLVGLDTFGGDVPRILFAAVEPSEALADLARANETAARRAGLKPEGRKFTPHVTLARLQAPRIDPIARYLGRRGGFTTEPFLVSQFVLFSSKPNTGGGPYVVEQVFPSTMGSFDDIEWDDDDDMHTAAFWSTD